jgi:hypothetical protein
MPSYYVESGQPLSSSDQHWLNKSALAQQEGQISQKQIPKELALFTS